MKSKIIYTDIINEHNFKILKNWDKLNIRKIRSISPKSKHITNNLEVIFYNFYYKETYNFSELLNQKGEVDEESTKRPIW